MQRAFSLLEIAVVLVIVSLMTAFGLQFLGKDQGEACYAQTQEQIARIQGALQHFTTTQGRLPKPARMGLGSSDPQFGTEAMGAITDPAHIAFATDVPSGIAQHAGVLIGTVPHTALGLSTADASDCWGSKFTYAVTNALTSTNAANGYPSAAQGAITLHSNTLASPQLQSNAAAYVVVSHGIDQYGATPMSAGDRTPSHCNGSSAPKIDRENCNSDAVFFSSTRNTGATTDYFDDVVAFGTKMDVPAPCPADTATWMTSCSGNHAVIAHGANEVVTNSAPGYTGSVTVTCNDGVTTQSAPTCTPSGPMSCASEGLNEGEGNYDGACNLTSCCGGVIVHQILSSPCPGAPYMAGGGNCPPAACDNNADDGLTGGQKYCAGVVYSACTAYLEIDDPETFSTSCGCSDAATYCESGSATLALVSSDRSTCPGGSLPHPIMIGCQDDYSCTCN